MAIEALERSRWIPVEERTPDGIDEYIVMIKGADKATTLWYDCWSERWYDIETDALYEVACWKPLPDPPGKDVNT